MVEDWKWWISSDDEEFQSIDASTREEAIEIGRGYYDTGPFYIIEAIKGRINWRCIDAATLLEQIDGAHADVSGDEQLIECTDEQGRDLEKVVGDAIAAWAERHKIHDETWGFGRTRNRERIEPPHV